MWSVIGDMEGRVWHRSERCPSESGERQERVLL